MYKVVVWRQMQANIAHVFVLDPGQDPFRVLFHDPFRALGLVGGTLGLACVVQYLLSHRYRLRLT